MFNRCLFGFLLLFIILLSSSGCKDKPAATEAPGEARTEPQIEIVPYPTDELLGEIGPENDLDTQWFLESPVYLVLGHPKRFLESDIGKGNEPIITGFIEQMLQIPFVPNKIERFIQVTGVPAMVTIEVEQNGQKVPQQSGMTRRSTMLTFSEPVKVDEIIKPFLSGAEDTAETRKQKVGDVEFYDLTPKDMTTPQRLGMAFPDEKTLIVVEGLQSDLDSAFNGKPTKSAAVDRLKRMDIQSNDLIWIMSLEGIDFDPRILESIIGSLIMQAGVPQGVAAEMVKHLRAMSISVNPAVEVGKPLAVVRFDAKEPEGAKTIGETFEGVVLMGQTTLSAMDDATKSALPIPADFAMSALNSLHVATEASRVDIRLDKFEDFESVVSTGIRDRQTAVQTAQIQQQRVEQLMMLHRIFMMCYQKDKKFPADIKAEDGTPLLSWRVALLPVLGLEELYKKFKLDEPWDGPTNKPLVDTMPMIYTPFGEGVKPPKTQLHFFQSEGTPFANAELKPEDLKQPNTTLMLFEAAPDKAVEWTKPGSPDFDLEKIEETVGPHLFGVTFSGQLVPGLVINNTEQQRKFLEALVKGLPLPEAAPPTEAPTGPTPPETAPKTE